MQSLAQATWVLVLVSPVSVIDARASGLSTPSVLSLVGTNSASSDSCISQIISSESSAGSGAADLTFHTRSAGGSFTSPAERMRIDSSGQVKVGTTGPTWDSTFRSFVTKGGFLASQSSSYSYLGGQAYYDGDFKRLNANAAELYEQSFGNHVFYNAISGAADSTITWNERMRIDGSGNLLVGTTDTTLYSNSGAGTGCMISEGGRIDIADTGTAMNLNKLSTNGEIISFRKDGTAVGSIQSGIGGRLALGHNDTGLYFADDLDAIVPWNVTANAVRDSAIDLGSAGTNFRFKDLYLSGGVYLGGTGAANKLDDYEEGTWTPVAVNYTGTLSTVRGSYVKIGKKVFIDLYCSTSDDSSTTAAFSISGLPFASDSTAGAYSTFSIMSYNNPAGTAIAGCQVPPSSSSIRMLKKTSATSPIWADWQGQDVNLGELNLSFSYSVA